MTGAKAGNAGNSLRSDSPRFFIRGAAIRFDSGHFGAVAKRNFSSATMFCIAKSAKTLSVGRISRRRIPPDGAHRLGYRYRDYKHTRRTQIFDGALR